MKYKINKDWIDETVVIIGGGPSLSGDLKIPSSWKVIAVNEAGLSKTPDADVLFFGDFRWFDWNRNRLKLFMGKETITRGYDYMYSDHIGVCRWDRSYSIHDSPQAIGGWCSGGSAIDLAYKRGAARIILLGFDMNDTGADNWHNQHKEPPTPNSRGDYFIPSLQRAASWLESAGVEVLNATPESRLDCFQRVKWESICQQA